MLSMQKSRDSKIIDIMQKPAPCSINAEKALLSAILINNGVIDAAMQKISSDDFYDSVCRSVFAVMEKLYSENKEIEAVSVSSILDTIPKSDGINYFEFLIKLFDMPEGLINTQSYIEIIKKKSIARKLLSLLDETKSLCYHSNDPYGVIYDIENNLSEIIEDKNKSGNYKLSDVVNNYINRDTRITGISTGFAYLDELTTGFQNSNLIVLAARPSIGKTALALKIALNMAASGKKIAFFTIEMAKEQIAERVISLLGKVDSKDLRKRRVSENLLTDILEKTEELGIYINDDSSINIVELKAKIKQLKREKQVDIVFIDYLQLIKPVNNKTPREQAISDISRGLKAIAKDLNMPIAALAQLNRLVEARSDKKPQLADLRESGSIEQDADLVMLIHRPGFYKKDGEADNDNSAEIIIAKQRNGATGVAELAFIKEFSSFEERAVYDDNNIFKEDF
ncbi:MAG: replicative DNA helicase [bacterium]